MKHARLLQGLFVVAGIYDGLLGVGFLFFPLALFNRVAVPPPNHVGYVQFPAALLIVFAVMFFVIALDPVTRRGLIPYGMLLKVSYCGVVGFHWVLTDVPGIWKPFVLFDLVFLLLFAWAMRVTRA